MAQLLLTILLGMVLTELSKNVLEADLGLKTCVYINVGARRVSSAVMNEIRELIPQEDIYVAKSVEEEERAAIEILEKKIDTLFLGGGDGTFVRFINRLIFTAGNRTLPVIGILGLGTGNAIAQLVSSGNALSDLKSFLANPSRDTYPLSLVETDGMVYPFGGLGWDGQWLEDYERLNTMFPEVVKGRVGYITAFILGTIPRKLYDIVTRKHVHANIINGPHKAFRVGPNGEKADPVEPGEPIYSGNTTSVALGTVPDYGYGIRILPFAGVDLEYMHLRVVTISMARVLLAAPSVYYGVFRHPGVQDFYVKSCSVDFSKPMPFEIAGESMGRKTHVDFSVKSSRMNLLRFI